MLKGETKIREEKWRIDYCKEEWRSVLGEIGGQGKAQSRSLNILEQNLIPI